MNDYFKPDQPGAYRGLYNFARGRNFSKTREFLKRQDAYTLHFPYRKKYKREKIIVGGIGQQYQSDLLDFQSLAKYNRGYRYIVVTLDVFSKKGWFVPVKKKTGPEIIRAFQHVFSDGVPLKLQTDRGTEFTNRPFQNFLKKQKVHHFFTRSEVKSSMAERLIRTLKAILERYFTANKTLKYIDALQDIQTGYNRSWHRSIGMAPDEVNFRNQEEIWQRLYSQGVSTSPTLAVGTKVRVSMVRGPFTKSSRASWSREIFTIARVTKSDPPVYELEDFSGEMIEGRFYGEELQEVIKEDDVFEVERILRKRKRDGKTEYFVKWSGYPHSFNSWVTGFI